MENCGRFVKSTTIYAKAKGAIELLGGLGGMLPQKILQS